MHLPRLPSIAPEISECANGGYILLCVKRVAALKGPSALKVSPRAVSYPDADSVSPNIVTSTDRYHLEGDQCSSLTPTSAPEDPGHCIS